MRRNIQLLATLTLFALTSALRAETWPTNCFPGWMHWRSQADMNSVVRSALVERVTAITNIFATTMPVLTSPVWYRSQRYDLTQYKTYVQENLLPLFAPQNDVSYYLAFYNDRTNFVNANFPVYTNLDILMFDCRLPLNYFDYTPWRCLDGLGPNTNDTTVGHGHGWFSDDYMATNIAGNYFPAGRTNWYTTDYGWDGMTAVCSRLVYAVGAPPQLAVRSNWYHASSSWGYHQVPDWSFATNCAETNWSFSASANDGKQFTAGVIYYGAYAVASFESSTNMSEAFPLPNLAPYDGLLFFWTRFALYTGNKASDDIVYDPLDTTYDQRGAWRTTDVLDPYTDEPYGMQVSDAFRLTATNCTIGFGVTNRAPWCSDPSVASNKVSARGWDTHSTKAVLYKYDWTNGFRWR